MFEITSIRSSARTWMYERVHTEPRWRIWTVAYYCLNLYMIFYILLVTEKTSDECICMTDSVLLSQSICDFLHTLSYGVKWVRNVICMSDTALLSINNINHYKLNHILEEECFTWNTIFYYLILEYYTIGFL